MIEERNHDIVTFKDKISNLEIALEKYKIRNRETLSPMKKVSKTDLAEIFYLKGGVKLAQFLDDKDLLVLLKTSKDINKALNSNPQ